MYLRTVLNHDALIVVANLLTCEVVGWGVDEDILGVHIIDAGTINFFYGTIRSRAVHLSW